MCDFFGCPFVADEQSRSGTHAEIMKQHYIDSPGFPSCCVCKREIKYAGSWLKHVNNCIQRNNESLKQCPLDDCGDMITLYDKQQHCSIKHGYPTCSGCSRSVRGVENWLKHVKRCITITDTTSTQCSLDRCDAIITTLTREEHFRTVHFYPACPTCTENITGPQNWLHHITSCNDRTSASVHCILCNQTMFSHFYDEHCVNHHSYPGCEVATCPETFTTRFNHAKHVLACRRKPVRKCPYAFNNCSFTGGLEAMLQHLDMAHSEHLLPAVRADKARNMLSCSSCYKNEFGNLYIFGIHVAKCGQTRFSCVGCGLGWSTQRSMDLHVCSKYQELTPAALLIKCQRPFYTMVHGASYNRTITHCAELVVNQLALSESFVPMIAATSGPFASLFIVNVAFESPALSLMPVDDLSRTRLAVFLACEPPQYIWVLLASELLTHTRNRDEFLETLRTAVIPSALLEYFSEEKLRDATFLRGERIHAYDMEEKYGRRLVYEAADGERPLNELMSSIGYASGKCCTGERVLHTGMVPATVATDMHTIMKARSEFNMPRESAQTAAAYDFFKSFSALWYETFGCFFIKHDDDNATQIRKSNTMWTIDHMSRTFDAFEAIKNLHRENLPRDLTCLGWVYPGKNGKTFDKEMRDYSFMELMWLEIKRERAGRLYSSHNINWLYGAPLVTPQQRDYSVEPLCLIDDPRFSNPSGGSKKRKLLLQQ